MQRWLDTPLVIGGSESPSAVYEAFIDEKTSQVAPLTVKFYKAKLSPFIVWCERQGLSVAPEITRQEIASFLGHIRRGRRKPLSNGALKLHHQTIKTFFNYVGETCETPVGWKNPVDGIKVKGSQAQTLEYSDDQIGRMFETNDSNPDRLIRLRNRALLTVLLNSAVRASELISMNVGDLSADGRIKATGKGSKQRVVTVGVSGLDRINAHLDFRSDYKGALWQTHTGKRLTTDAIRGLFERIERKNPEVFADGLYAHRFRHTAITRMLRAKVRLRSVQRYAGHSNPQTTLKYAQSLDSDEALDFIESSNFIDAISAV